MLWAGSSGKAENNLPSGERSALAVYLMISNRLRFNYLRLCLNNRGFSSLTGSVCRDNSLDKEIKKSLSVICSGRLFRLRR